MALVNNHKSSNKIFTAEHLTKSTNHKTAKMEELNSTPATNITEETTAESFYNTFDKKDQNAATEALKKVTNQASEKKNGEKEEVDQSRLHLNDTGVSVLVRNFKTFLTNFE